MGRTACTEPQCLYSTAIPLLHLRTVRPVQSLSACTVQLYLYSLYGPYGLYRASVPVQGCNLLTLYIKLSIKVILFLYLNTNVLNLLKRNIIYLRARLWPWPWWRRGIQNIICLWPVTNLLDLTSSGLTCSRVLSERVDFVMLDTTSCCVPSC